MKFQIRQGDVLVEAAKIPKSAKAEPREDRVVLAHGEVTGHCHAFYSERVRMFRDDGLARAFIRVTGKEPVELQHEEHGAVAHAPGDYEVIRQREYSPEAIRDVAD